MQRLKAKMQHLSPKTANNALTVLAKMLRVAVEWKVIDKMPATVRLLKVTHNEMEFYEESDLERLVEAAGRWTRSPTWPCCSAAMRACGWER